MDGLTKYSPWALGLLRVTVALGFMQHGTQKLFGFPAAGGFGGGAGGPPGGGAGGPPAGGFPGGAPPAGAPSGLADGAASGVPDAASSGLDAAAAGGGMPGYMGTLMFIAGILEAFGGLAILFGFLTRPIGFILAGECAVIFWWFHVVQMSGGTIFPIANGGELSYLYCFTFFYLVFAGPGAFAVDGLIFRKQPTVTAAA